MQDARIWAQNTEYWNEGVPKLDQITFEIGLEPIVALLRLQQGQAAHEQRGKKHGQGQVGIVDAPVSSSSDFRTVQQKAERPDN